MSMGDIGHFQKNYLHSLEVKGCFLICHLHLTPVFVLSGKGTEDIDLYFYTTKQEKT